jgi:hypothetical protein
VRVPELFLHAKAVLQTSTLSLFTALNGSLFLIYFLVAVLIVAFSF